MVMTGIYLLSLSFAELNDLLHDRGPHLAFTGRFFRNRAVRPRFLIRWSLQRKPEYQEESHVSPRIIIAMGTDRVNLSAAPKSSTSGGAGVVELWHGAREIMWHHQRCGTAGSAGEYLGVDPAAAVARMVLRCDRQERRAAASVGGEHLLWLPAALGVSLVACDRAAAGLGDG